MQPFIIGHRGCAYEPENTLRSVKKAVDLGVDGVEIDVRRCKSGEIIIIHDNKVDRTTNGKGYVKDFALGELKRLDAGKGEKIPTLEEAINLIKSINQKNKKQIKIIIELKEKGLEKDVAKIIEKDDFTKSVIVISFYHQLIKNIKSLNKKISTGILFVGNPINIVDLAKGVSADFLFPKFDYVGKNLVDTAHKNNLKVFVWNIDDIENLKKMLKLKVDGIASNKPDILINHLKN